MLRVLRRTSIALPAALLMASAARGAGPRFDHYDGGGESRSPDGRWRLWSRPPDADEADEAPAWLSGPGVRQQLLMRYERSLDVTWMADRRHIVLRSQDTHLSTLAVFALPPGRSGGAWRLEAMIEAVLARVGPRLARVENRSIAYGRRFAIRPCVLVEESGLPPDRSEGSFIVRRAAFRLDPRRRLAVRIARCPGAHLGD